MESKLIVKEYIDIIKDDISLYSKDYENCKEKVIEAKAFYKGKPIPFLYQPMFYTEDDIKSFEKLSNTLMRILNKVIDKYVIDSKFRKKFGFSKELEELILIDPGYGVNVPIGRFDLFYKDKDNFKFCELNADGASAMNEDRVLNEILLESKAIKNLSKKYFFYSKELINKWVEEAINIYKKFDKNVENPNVAIMDLSSSLTIEEFKVFKDAFINKGYNALIVDPRDLKYVDGKLYHNDYRIDLIYRRLVTVDMMNNIDDMKDFIKAYKDRNVCVIGGIRSQIIHNKIIFKILHDEDTLEFLNGDEREFIKKHIPYTKVFNDEKLIIEATYNKDNLVLKPKDLYGAKGVFIGRDYKKDEWEKLLKENLGDEYLIQEFCEPDKINMVKINNNKTSIEKFGHMIGMFMYNEKFAGFYTRVGQNNIITTAHGGYSVGNLIVRKR